MLTDKRITQTWIAVIAIIALMAVAGCHSQRNVEKSTRMGLAEHMNVSADMHGNEMAWQWWMMSGWIDSLRMKMSADSIRTPHGTIYGAVVEAEAKDAGIESAGQGLSESENRSELSGNAETAAEAETSETTDNETTVVAQPPGYGTWIAAGIIAALIMSIIIFARRRNKHKS